MAAIRGVQRNYHKKFTFLVEIAGVVSAGFQTCGELAIEAAKIEHHEGGSLIPNKSLGRVTVPDVELTRGATDDLDVWDWIQQAVALGGVQSDEQIKKSIDIVQQNRNGLEIQRWTLVNAFPVRWSSGDWDNNADENRIEKLTLTYDYPTPGGD